MSVLYNWVGLVVGIFSKNLFASILSKHQSFQQFCNFGAWCKDPKIQWINSTSDDLSANFPHLHTTLLWFIRLPWMHTLTCIPSTLISLACFPQEWCSCNCVLFFYSWWPQCLPSTTGTAVMCIVSCQGSTAIHHYFICWNLIGSYQTLLILPFHFKHCCRKDKCRCCLEGEREREREGKKPPPPSTNVSGFVWSRAISPSVAA